MVCGRTKRLTIDRVLRILQLRYGSQVQSVTKENNLYLSDSIFNHKNVFTREDILELEDDMYSSFGV